MTIRDLREKINLFIYNSKATNLKRLKVASLFISFAAISALFYYHGFQHSESTGRLLQLIVEFSFGFYTLHYLVKVFYDFHPKKFIKKNWIEGFIVGVLILEAVSYNLFDVLLVKSLFHAVGFDSGGAITVVFMQFYLLIVVGFELSDSTYLISNAKIHPSNIFILSFLLLITVGTILLMMPEMTVGTGGMPFIDALFTSTSATCVTGLSVVDTATYFSFKGQMIIMVLMKLGGLNIVSFAYLAAFLGRFGFGVKQDEIIEDFLTKGTLHSAKGMLKKVFFTSIAIEAIGAVLIFLLITSEMPFESSSDKWFFSIFHSISAFNNGGFSTLTDGMYSIYLQQAFLMHVVVAGLIFFGAFGFTFMFDMFDPKQLRDRLRHPWKRPSFGSRIAVNTYIFLVLFGAAVIWLLEADNTLSEMNFIESIITVLFQSISARSAGLNTIDMHSITVASAMFLIFLMFVGGNTFSTAGGIKTSTFALIMANTYSVIRGKKSVDLFNRRISEEDLLKAFTVLTTFAGGMLLCIVVLCATEQHILALPDRSVLDIVFEEVSAFSTCGLSTGITGMMSSAGKTILVVSMFVGRLGTLTIAFALARKISTNNYSFPTEHIMVG